MQRKRLLCLLQLLCNWFGRPPKVMSGSEFPSLTLIVNETTFLLLEGAPTFGKYVDWIWLLGYGLCECILVAFSGRRTASALEEMFPISLLPGSLG